MNDQKILGLNENFTYKDLKAAFRKKSKEFHPDLNNSSLESHFSMIRLNKAYSNLLKLLKTSKFKDENLFENSYDIYKKGIVIFQGIHPSKWKRIKKKNIFKSAGGSPRPTPADS